MIRLSVPVVLLLACGAPGSGGGFGGGGEGGAGASGESESQMHALSGARLKVRTVQGEDGSRVFWSMRDAMHSVDCAFQMAEDMKLRCLPVPDATSTIRLDNSSISIFSDSGCTKRAASASIGCTAEPKFAVSSTLQCPRTVAVYSTTLIGNALFAGSPTNCQPFTPESGMAYYSLEKVNPGEFAAGTLAEE